MGEESADDKIPIPSSSDSDIPGKQAIKDLLEQKVQEKFHELKRDMTTSHSQVITLVLPAI